MICLQTDYLTAQTLGGSIVCRGLLQGDARIETKGSGVRLFWYALAENSCKILVMLCFKMFLLFKLCFVMLCYVCYVITLPSYYCKDGQMNVSELKVAVRNFSIPLFTMWEQPFIRKNVNNLSHIEDILGILHISKFFGHFWVISAA